MWQRQHKVDYYIYLGILLNRFSFSLSLSLSPSFFVCQKYLLRAVCPELPLGCVAAALWGACWGQTMAARCCHSLPRLLTVVVSAVAAAAATLVLPWRHTHTQTHREICAHRRSGRRNGRQTAAAAAAAAASLQIKDIIDNVNGLWLLQLSLSVAVSVSVSSRQLLSFSFL